MSLTGVAPGPAGMRYWARGARRLAAAILALVLVACAIWLLVRLGSGFAGATPPPKNPFGIGLREAAPSANGLGGALLAIQSGFSRALNEALTRFAGGEGLAGLVGLGFAYGVFHAAGPGHGKAVISGYLLASRRTLVKGLGLSLGAALVQAGVAIGIVSVFTLALRATAATLGTAIDRVEHASFAVLVLVGLALLWRKTAGLVPDASSATGPQAAAHDEDCVCREHAHMPPPSAIERARTWRDGAGIMLAAGIRPCSGAIIILVFAASQHLFAAGVAAVLAMALGTALTTGSLAALAVLAKRAALALCARHGSAGRVAASGIEVLAAAFVTVIGAALLLGTWGGAPT